MENIKYISEKMPNGIVLVKQVRCPYCDYAIRDFNLTLYCQTTNQIEIANKYLIEKVTKKLGKTTCPKCKKEYKVGGING